MSSTNVAEVRFEEDVRKAYARTGREAPSGTPLRVNILKDSVSLWGSVAWHLTREYNWRYREVEANLFLDLVEVELWDSFLADTNEQVFQEEVINLLTSQEIGLFVRDCLNCNTKFYFGEGAYRGRGVGESRVPTRTGRWFDLLCEWRDMPETPIEWLLPLI